MSQNSTYICFAVEIRINLGKRLFSDVRTSITKLNKACLTSTACFGLSAPSTLNLSDLQHKNHLYKAFQDILKQTLQLI